MHNRERFSTVTDVYLSKVLEISVHTARPCADGGIGPHLYSAHFGIKAIGRCIWLNIIICIEFHLNKIILT